MKEVLEITKENAEKAFKEGSQDNKTFMSRLFPKHFPVDITERLKTFEDACLLTGRNPKKALPYPCPDTKDEEALNAVAMAWIIAEAANEGWEPDWDNSSQQKWYIWWDMRSGGFGFSCSCYFYVCSFTGVGSRLCFPSEKIARYIGKTFPEVFKKIMVKK